MYQIIHSNELRHHGIKGMRWGVKNGPPYPLDEEDRSASEKKAIDREQGHRYNKKVKAAGSSSETGEAKKKSGLRTALKIGATAALAGLTVYGGYKLYQSGAFNRDLPTNAGKEAIKTIFGDAPDFQVIEDSANSAADGLKRLKTAETLSETITKVNPHRGDPHYKNNCAYCGITAILRQRGFDVTAGSTQGRPQNLLGVVEECFKNAKTLEGSAVKFGKSPEDAADFLIKRYGSNATGVCGIEWKNKQGHIFNWIIKDGSVSFYDAQTGDGDVSRYWRLIDHTGHLQLARLDNADIISDSIAKIVE